jgi:ABC-type transport system involved in cytochrome c biogenesis permease subunit
VSFCWAVDWVPRYARGALRFFVYLEAHCAFLIYITLLIKKNLADCLISAHSYAFLFVVIAILSDVLQSVESV